MENRKLTIPITIESQHIGSLKKQLKDGDVALYEQHTLKVTILDVTKDITYDEHPMIYLPDEHLANEMVGLLEKSLKNEDLYDRRTKRLFDKIGYERLLSLLDEVKKEIDEEKALCFY